VRSRTAGVKTTLMRNGRDRRLGKPVRCHARRERVLLSGTRSADHIKASGQSGCIQRPDTWLHPNASLKRQIPLAPRAPSIHGTFETCPPILGMSVHRGVDRKSLAECHNAALLTHSRKLSTGELPLCGASRLVRGQGNLAARVRAKEASVLALRTSS
jgi:hypothetical protein